MGLPWGCSHPSLTGHARDLLTSLVTLLLLRLGSAQLRVVGPGQPLTATVGQDVVLPCHLSPQRDARSLEVRWIRDDLSETVHHYRNGEDLYGEQMGAYAGRTELSRDGLSVGSLDLRITGLRPSDDGVYICTVGDAHACDEATVHLELSATGADPHLSLGGYEAGGVRVLCRSAGWYPLPQLLWTGARGQHLPLVSQTHSQDQGGFFEIGGTVIVTGSMEGPLSCVVRSSRLQQERQFSLHIAAPFFHNAQPFIVALALVVVLLAVSFGLSVYLCRKQAAQRRELEKQAADRADQTAVEDEYRAKAVQQSARLQEQEAELVRKDSEIKEQAAELAELKAEQDEYRAKAEHQSTRLQEVAAELDEYRAKAVQQSARLQEQEAELARKDSELAELKAERDEYRAKAEHQSTRLQEVAAQLDEYRAKAEHQSARLQEQAAELSQKDKRLEETNASLEHQSARLQEQEAELARKDSELGEQAAQLAWRMFLLPQNTGKVTLDPRTAHPLLVLSQNKSSVRWQSKWQHLPSAPERFDTRCCVLGCEEFREGRHCWEVEVEGEKGKYSSLAVGVARASVKRKGEINMSPEEGIWVVQYNEGQLTSLTSPPTPLYLSPVPTRIWVCLDCTQGQVSFINADNGVKIYTFREASFNGESMRPWFWLGTNAQLYLRDSTL